MLYRTIETHELVENKDAEREIIDLMENNGAHLKLVFLKKHAEIEPHMSHTDACIYVTEGEVEIKFNLDSECSCQACECALPDENDKDGKKYKVKKEQMFFFEKNVMHSLKALKDSSFLLIKI
ncbi:MAG: hypothetical protein LUH05_06335 [Candidatus Gastranaerophilales bacterium]|nr:hypothetical protein [Candidatus Gastranaerophilales bacterium]